MADFAHVNGVTIHHASDGPRDGSPVVFANALGTDLRIWDPVLPLLPNHRLIRHDQRGHGLSGTGATPFSIALLADDLAALMETLSAGPATVVGLSVGGLVAQALASRRPDLVARLVLVGTAAKIGTADMWSERVAIVRERGIAPLVEPTMERWFTRSFRLTGNPDFDGYRTMLARAAPDGYCATAEAIGRTDLTARSAGLSLPVACAAGEDDSSTPPDLVRGLADLIPGASYVTIGRAAHIVPVERPDAIAALVRGEPPA